MKKFKNFFIVAMLTLAMVLALAACGCSGTAPSESDSGTTEEAVDGPAQGSNAETSSDEETAEAENEETTAEVAEGSGNSNAAGDATQQTAPSQQTNPSRPDTSGSKEPTTHVHDWVAITTVVHHDAITHEETVYKTVHHDAVTHEEPVYTYVDDIACNQCGLGLKTNFDGDWDAFLDHCTYECGSAFGGRYIQILVGYDTITDKEAWDEQVPNGTRTVIDKAAWDETVVTGYRCSICGETK